MSDILITNDARPVMGSLLMTAALHGFKPEEIDDGEEIINLNSTDLGGKSQHGFTRDYAGAVDEYYLDLRHESGHSVRLHAMFGNDPEDMVANFSISSDPDTEQAWERVAKEFASRWAGRSWPKRKRIWANTAGYVDVD